jgi:general stress protein 26
MSDELINEALEFVREHPTSHLATVDNGKPTSRVMYCPRVDDDFTVWYATSAGSNKVRQIKANPAVCVVFYLESKYVRVLGAAEEVSDKSKTKELWENDWARYWKDGPEDPDYVLLKIKPEEVEFLDLTRSEEMLRKIM